ncbi:extracellular solute-binding protein [Amycolatopsis sp. NPDC051128]|uniref:extracellular solute-binding protein n=1 Tax=Amycolatopsis sp. NPDC051128 TaxID=3155412 RepID=UPI00342A60E7
MTTVIDLWITESPNSTLPGFGDPLVLAAESFNRAHPRFEVRIRKVEVHLMPEAVAQAVAQGNPPDVVEYTYSSTQTALDTRAANGDPLFVPIQRAIGGRTEILGEPVVVEDLVPTVRRYYSVGGELVSVPSMVTTNLLYANKTVLDRAGIEQLPVTWKDLTAACAKIAELPDGPGHGVSWPNYGWVFHMELAGQGALLTNGDNGRSGRATRVFLDSPEMLNYVGWWKEMLDSGYYLPTEELHYFTCMQAFARQEIAFVVTSSAVGQMMVGMAAEAGFELTAGQLPRPDEECSPGGPVAGHSLFLTAGLPKEKEDGALAFLQHQLNEHHGVARICTPGNPMTSLPITRAAYERTTADDWADPFPGFRSATAQVTSAGHTPAAAGPMVGSLNSINIVLTQAAEDVLLRGAEPAARFRAATEEAQQVLDRYNAAALAYPPVTPDDLSAG